MQNNINIKDTGCLREDQKVVQCSPRIHQILKNQPHMKKATKKI